MISFFVPIQPRNLKNMRGHWRVRHQYSQEARSWTAILGRREVSGELDPTSPKRILLVAHLPRRFDSHDGLRAALAPFVDGLQVEKIVNTKAGVRVQSGCGIIHHDGVNSGHVIQYVQTNEPPYGVRVTVEW